MKLKFKQHKMYKNIQPVSNETDQILDAKPKVEDRRTLVDKARLAEDIERNEDVIENMNNVVKLGQDLTVEERNLFANAYKIHVGAKRTAWRVLLGIEQKIEGTSRRKELSRGYRIQVEDELKHTCKELIQMIDTLLMVTKDVENEIFYLKMKADFFRYLAEVCRNTHNDKVFDDAKVAYARAYELARENLSPGHPLRLGLVLNFSVFYHELLDCQEMAQEIARESVEEAEEDLHSMHGPPRSDTELLIQMINDNLKLWKHEKDKSTNAVTFA